MSKWMNAVMYVMVLVGVIIVLNVAADCTGYQDHLDEHQGEDMGDTSVPQGTTMEDWEGMTDIRCGEVYAQVGCCFKNAHSPLMWGLCEDMSEQLCGTTHEGGAE